MTLELHGYAPSVYCWIVRLVLHEKSIEHRWHEVDPFAHPLPAHYLRANPFGRVPTLVHDDFTLYETSAIVRYVDEIVPEPSLQPDSARGRARALQIAGVVDAHACRPLVRQVFSHDVRRPLHCGAWLCWLGAKGLRSAWRGGTGVVGPADSRGPVADVGYGLAVTLTNPKVALVWASLATFVAPAIGSVRMLALFALGTAVIAYAIYGGYGWLFSARGARALHARFARAADAAFGALFTALGLSLLFGRG